MSNLNDFWITKLKKQSSILPKSDFQILHKEAELFSSLNVQSETDYELVLKIKNFLPRLLAEICPVNLSAFQKKQVLLSSFQILKSSNDHSLHSFYQAAKQALNKNKFPLIKNCYPNDQSQILPLQQYNIDKWLETMKKIYSGLQKGVGYNNSLELCTEGWDPVEKNDFQSWVKYYSQGEHLKYKTAQYYQAPGVNIPIEDLVSSLPAVPQTGISNTPNESEIAQKKIFSLIGRLNAAEKLFTDPQVQKALGKRGVKVEDCLEGLHALKRKIQSASFRVLASLVEDLELKEISKTATDNILEDFLYREFYRVGERKNLDYLVRYAQAAPTSTPPGPLPSNSGAPANPMPPNNMPLDSGANVEPTKDEGVLAVEEFIAGLNGEDVGETWDDEIEMDEPIKKTQSNSFLNRIKLSQAVPANLPSPEKVNTNPFQAGALIPPVIEKDIGMRRPDEIFESALKDVKISDVIERLEALADVFRNREISRQMAIIDLFMDRLGIATFFPSLAEASTKTLESNQYALTRIEDIISKLRGSVDVPEMHKIILDKQQDIDRPAPEADPEIVKNKLQKEEIKESIEGENEARQEFNEPIENNPVAPQVNNQIPNQPITNQQQDLAAPIPVQVPQPRR